MRKSKKINILINLLLAIVLLPKTVFAKDIYDIVLFWGQSNMVGIGIRDGEKNKDTRVKDIDKFSSDTGIDTDILKRYTMMNHVDVPLEAKTVYDYTYDYDAKQDIFTAVTRSTVDIGKTIYVSVSNNKPVFKSKNTGTFAVQHSYGTQMSPYFGKVWYEKTGHKLVIVLAANRGESIANFLPHGTNNKDEQYIYEAMKDIYTKAVSYVNNTYGSGSIGHKFYVVFQGESDTASGRRGKYKDTFLQVHKNLKKDLNLEFGVMVETSHRFTPNGKVSIDGVEAIHKAQEQIIKENSDIILGSTFSYDNYKSVIDGDLKSLKKACLSRYQLNDDDFDNIIHFNAAALSQIGKESATNAAKYLANKNKVKVIFNKNDGSTTTASQTFEVGNSWDYEAKKGNKFGYNVDGTPKWENTGQFGRWDREGYILLGWNLNANDTEAKYSIYSSVSDSFIKNNSPEIKLYAIWKKKDDQVISFDSSSISKIYGSSPFIKEANLTRGNGNITYKSTNNNVATVNSATGKVTIKAVGTTTIIATASETKKYNSASTKYTLYVTKANSEITLSEYSSVKTFGDQPFYITITKQIGDGAISCDSDNKNVATVSNDGVISIVGAGSTRIIIKKAATNNYNGAVVAYDLTVKKAPQTMKYDNEVVNMVYGNGSFVVSLSQIAGNGNITYTSSNTNVAIVDNSGNVIIKNAGETFITAKISSTNNYSGGESSYKLVVSKANQKLIFSSSKVTKNITDDAFKMQLQHTVGGGTIRYTSSNTGVATVNNNGTVTIKSVGTTTITATASSTNNYNETSTSYTLIVKDEGKKLIINESDFVKTYGDPDFSISTTVFVNNATVTYSSSNINVATVNNKGKISIVGAGTAKIIATVNPNSTNQNDSDDVTITVKKANQDIKFLQTEVNKEYLDADFTILPNLTNTKGTVTYSSSNTNIATVDNTGKVHIVGVGNVKINAIANETNNYNSASASYNLIISRINQKISFSEESITKKYGDDSFTLSANKLEGDGTISYRSSNSSIATVDNNGKVTILTTGTVTITATASQTSKYNEAKTSYALIIHKADQEIKFANTNIVKKLDDEPFTIEATRISGNGEITYESSNEKVAVVDDNGLVKILSKGSTTIKATANSTNNYNSASASYSLNVLESPQNISFDETAVTVTYGEESPTVALEHTLGNGEVFYESNNENVATIDGNGKITITGAGEAIITAIASETDKYDRTETSFSLTVKKAKQEILLPEKEIIKKLGNDNFKLDINQQKVKGELVLISENENIAKINDDNYIELLSEGETNIIVKALETNNYTEAVNIVKLKVEGKIENKVIETVTAENTSFKASKLLSILSMIFIVSGIIIILKFRKVKIMKNILK